MKEDQITLISLGVAFIVLGYLAYFTVSFASQDVGQYFMEKSIRNVAATDLPGIYKNAAAIDGKVNSLMYAIVAIGAVSIAVLSFLEYLKYKKLTGK
jgi:hypothetical protein